MSEKKAEVILAEITTSKDILPFESEYASYESLTQMIRANELKYIEAVLDVAEEKRLLDENISDLIRLPMEVQTQAVTVAEKMKYDPEYLHKNQVDTHILNAVQIVININSKRDEIFNKNWTAEYRARLVVRLRSYRNKVKKPLKRLFSK